MESNDTNRRASLPAPWHLTGRGCILLMRFSPTYLREHTGLPPSLRAGFRSNLAWVMFVDYETADCGPYRELLFIPGSSQFSEGRFLTISKIFVSTETSVVNGRANWGIPKERCDFSIQRSGSEESVRLTHAGKDIADLTFRAFGPRLPMIVRFLPRRWLTLGQHLAGKEFIYTPEVTGRFRLARVQRAWGQSPSFPDLGQGRILSCFAVTGFKMKFPTSRIHDLKTLPSNAIQ